MRALITGAAGQDGHFLAAEMIQRGWDVTATSLRESDFLPGHAAHGCQVGTLDVMQGHLVADLFCDWMPDVVFHLASMSSVGGSWADPATYMAVNPGGTCNVLLAAEAMDTHGGRAAHVIHASSAEIFAEDAPLPFTEQTPIRPRNPYGVSKAAAHFLVQTYRARGLPASNAILFNHESHLRPASFVIGKIARRVAAIKEGRSTGLSLGNLGAQRDWLHASDVAAALVDLAIRREVGDYVVASGVSRTVAEFVEAAFASVGIDNWSDYVRTDPALLRTTDAPELRGDPSHLAEVTGWKPRREFADWVAEMVALAPLDD